MHYYAAQDESGDLGFDFDKKGTSSQFCIAILISSDKKRLEKVVKRMFSYFSRQRIKHKSDVLHAYNESERTNKLVIKKTLETDAQAFVIRVDKSKVTRRDVDEFYNDLTIRLLEKIFAETGAKKITLTASRKDTKDSVTKRFIASLDTAYGDEIEVDVKRPSQSKSLQVADCISWSLFRHYEYEDDTFYNEIIPILHEYDY